MATILRLVAWNVNMGLDRKMDALRALRPDVAILPECANQAILGRKLGTAAPKMVWIGKNSNKGLGVLAFGDYDLELSPEYDHRLEWIAPVHVRGPVTFFLLGAWCLNHRAHKRSPLTPNRQFEPALGVYTDIIRTNPTVAAGDFNNNATWDRPGRTDNFHATIAAAESAGLVSAYHAKYGAEFGAEPHPTIYWRDRKEDSFRYHIDFCFVPQAWLPFVTSVTVGDFTTWVGSGLSDHAPVVVELLFP